MMTLAELAEAYKRGEKDLTPMSIDNDYVAVHRVNDPDWVDVETVYEAHPYELIRQALDLLGIPWSNV